jgi:hypothetical protein
MTQSSSNMMFAAGARDLAGAVEDRGDFDDVAAGESQAG